MCSPPSTIRDFETALANAKRRVRRHAAKRKRLESELRNTRAALESARASLAKLSAESEAARKAKDEFLANVSHEIRTPLTAILGFAELLAESLADADSLDAALTIKRNGEHLLEIVNDILDLSKIEAGRLGVELVPCSPTQIAADICDLMSVRAKAKGLTLAWECDGRVPERVLSDPTRLRQILFNIVGNAVKFTETGSIRVVVRWEEHAERPLLQFDVVDTGIGIREEQIESLFEPFCQGDSSMTRRYGGTGLGLAICRRLARLLDGDISVCSVPGRGSRFRVTIDPGLRDQGPTRRLADQDWRRPCGPFDLPRCEAHVSRRVLLVEDSLDNRRVLSRILERAGFQVTVAEHGQEAIDRVAAALKRDDGSVAHGAQSFDVILMDMQMPVLNGYEATRRLREMGYAGPIVALTAHAMTHDRDKCLRAGCDDFATKPIDKETLLSKVLQHTDNGPSRR